ncbi:hypothetical protein Ddc_19380 [Ditylenchus destructor]|nr:hypothetical protein Ddc_19380 [Ditylenchus destructor]
MRFTGMFTTIQLTILFAYISDIYGDFVAEHQKSTALLTRATEDEAMTKGVKAEAGNIITEIGKLKTAVDADQKIVEDDEKVIVALHTADPSYTNMLAKDEANYAKKRADAAVDAFTKATTGIVAAAGAAKGKIDTAATNAGTNLAAVKTKDTACQADNDEKTVAATCAATLVEADKVQVNLNEAEFEFYNVKYQFDLAKNYMRKADDATPVGRAAADKVSEQVIQQEADENRARYEAQRLTEIKQKAMEQRQMDQTQHWNTVGDTGGYNIAHFHDEIYDHPARGDSDTDCLNHVERCGDPSFAAMCGGTCTRQTNGDDHADNCSNMQALCEYPAYQDLMSAYCHASCG